MRYLAPILAAILLLPLLQLSIVLVAVFMAVLLLYGFLFRPERTIGFCVLALLVGSPSVAIAAMVLAAFIIVADRVKDSGAAQCQSEEPGFIKYLTKGD